MRHLTIKEGQEFRTNEGSLCKVVSFVGRLHVAVKFLDKYGHEAVVRAQHLHSGSVKNPYHPSVIGVGFIGSGRHKPSVDRKMTPEYEAWRGILTRCYSQEYHSKRPTYVGCSVQSSWHDFQVFADWLVIQDGWRSGHKAVDKDLSVRGNNVYAPEFCSVIPESLNSIFSGGAGRNGQPKGVSWHSSKKKYIARCCDGSGKTIHLGQFTSSEEAFAAYKDFKESVIKKLALRYKSEIPRKVYDSLMAYEVSE